MNVKKYVNRNNDIYMLFVELLCGMDLSFVSKN